MSNSSNSIKYDQDNPYYNGSVQTLYSVIDDPGSLVSETSLGGSVFDVGTIFDIKNLPAHLMIIGGGPISCEIGQAFQNFGSKVTIIEELDRLLPKDDPDASKLLAEVLREDGIDLLFDGDHFK